MCPRESYKKKKFKKYKQFFASLKSLKKGVGFGSVSQRGGLDPRIRIRTKMSQIPNTGLGNLFQFLDY